MGNSTGNANKKSTTGKKDETKVERWNMLWRKGKSNSTSKRNHTIRGNKPESTSERRKTKKLLTGKNNTNKTGNSKTTKEILSPSRKWMHRFIRKTGWQGNKTIFEQNMATKKTWQKSRMDKKRVRRTRRRSEGENTSRFTQSKSQNCIKFKNARIWYHTWILV